MEHYNFGELFDIILRSTYNNQIQKELKLNDYIAVLELIEAGAQYENYKYRISTTINNKIYVTKKSVQDKIDKDYKEYVLNLIDNLINLGEK